MHLTHRDEDTWDNFISDFESAASDYDHEIQSMRKVEDGVNMTIVDKDDTASVINLSLRFFECEIGGEAKDFIEIGNIYNEPVYVTAKASIVFAIIYA